MLFLTVYGPELESLFCYIHKHTQSIGFVSREQIYSIYLPHAAYASKGQAKNLEDALSYLKVIGLIVGETEYSSTQQYFDTDLPFAVLLLHQFRQLEYKTPNTPPLDLLYLTALNQLYIRPNCVWHHDLHEEVNQLPLAKQIGGVSQEKIGAWKRVMEFLGLGNRIKGGFYCLYRPELVYAVARQWNKKEGTLQEFFEEHLHHWLPCLTDRGEVAQSVTPAFDWLAARGKIFLYSKQDSPSKSYFGTRNLRGITIP